mmetsp:Transcript_9173/g.17134  ORF Transcript_9173/g.17134 Transcript_9173/m.17134 type:complete len:416 (+) Transcript_9173:42-1289(+)
MGDASHVPLGVSSSRAPDGSPHRGTWDSNCPPMFGNPLTSRSGSSHETPRNGGGFTARSSGGEKGTPRDAQRLALGERPRDGSDSRAEGWSGGPLVSPQHTARSAALSSEPWSASLSSRTGSGSLDLAAEDIALGVQHPGELQHQRAAADSMGAAYHLDLQKSLEVMRFVIMKENQKLKDFIQQTRDAITEMGEQLEGQTARAITNTATAAGAVAAGAAVGAAAGGVAESVDAAWHSGKSASPNTQCQELCHVEWCIQNVGEALISGQRHGDSEYCERTKFRRRGLEFELRFYPLATATIDVANPAAARQYEAVLDVWASTDSASASSGLAASADLRVALSVSADADAHGTVSAVAVLQGMGRVACRGAWPLLHASSGGVGLPANVICRVHVEELCGWGPGRLHLHSSWRPPPGG